MTFKDVYSNCTVSGIPRHPHSPAWQNRHDCDWPHRYSWAEAPSRGKINIAVNSSPLQNPEAKSIFISKLTIGVTGVEEINDGRRKFLSLTTDVFNKSYPPPMTLVDSQTPISHSELFWALKPASTSIAFCINLLLGVGHPHPKTPQFITLFVRQSQLRVGGSKTSSDKCVTSRF